MDTVKDFSLIALFVHKNVTCVAINEKYLVRVGIIHACQSDGAMFKFCLSHLKTEEQMLGIIILLPVTCARQGKSTGTHQAPYL